MTPDREVAMEPRVTSCIFEPWASQPVTLPGNGASLRQVFVKAGHVAERHSHPHEQFLRVISGAGRLACEGGTIALLPGTGIHLPTGAWHSAEFTADTVLLEVNLV